MSSIFALFPALVGVMLLGIWSNIHAYAQQSSSPSLSASPPAAASSRSTTTISPQLKAKICDPSNPSLKVVNTTESKICGIPKTVKPRLLSSKTPQTSAVSSSLSSPTQQTVTTAKPTTATTSVAAPHPKQLQPIASTNNSNTVLQLNKGTTGAKIAPVSLPNTNSSSLSSTSQSGIAPQIKAVNQQPPQPIRGINGVARQIRAVNDQKQPLAASQATVINSTAGQNYPFTTSSPAATSDQVLYLGYRGNTNPTHVNSDSKNNDSHDSNADTHSSTRSVSDSSSSKDKDTTDSSFSAKKKTISTNAENSSRNKKTPNTESSTDHDPDSGSSVKKRTKSDRTDSTSEDGRSKHTCYYHHNSIINIKTCY